MFQSGVVVMDNRYLSSVGFVPSEEMKPIMLTALSWEQCTRRGFLFEETTLYVHHTYACTLWPVLSSHFFHQN